MSHPRGYIPIDRAEIVAVLVRAYFGKLDALAAKYRPVLSGKNRPHKPARAELDLLDLLQDFRPNDRGGTAHGTCTASNILAMIPSEVTSSASASNVNSTRCRNTSGAIALTSSGTTYALPRKNA